VVLVVLLVTTALPATSVRRFLLECFPTLSDSVSVSDEDDEDVEEDDKEWVKGGGALGLVPGPAFGDVLGFALVDLTA